MFILLKILNKRLNMLLLDVDTRLLLDNAVELIGTMAHPLNRPVLNSAKNKVIEDMV